MRKNTFRNRVVAGFWLLSGLLVAGVGHAQTEIFLGLGKKPEYTSIDAPPDIGDNDVLRVSSYTAGGSKPVTVRSLQGPQSGRLNLQDVSLVLQFNEGKIGQLVSSAASGQLLEEVYIVQFSTTTGSPIERVSIKLNPVVVSSVSFSNSDAAEVRSEIITLNYRCIHYTVRLFTDAGVPDGIREFEWNRAENKAEC